MKKMFYTGHFAPRADQIFGAHTRATFHFINVNPQWQIFNGGVWNNLETAVRDFAIKSGNDMIAYTGKCYSGKSE